VSVDQTNSQQITYQWRPHLDRYQEDAKGTSGDDSIKMQILIDRPLVRSPTWNLRSS
jgi:hypothetical protein